MSPGWLFSAVVTKKVNHLCFLISLTDKFDYVCDFCYVVVLKFPNSTECRS